LDQGIRITPPTLEKLKRNLGAAGLGNLVTIVPTHSWEVVWDKPISLLFIDGLHDYVNVARDFHHFETWLAPGAYVAFHDYADYYPGVRTFVNELLKAGQFQRVYCASSMMVVRKNPQSEPSDLGDFQSDSPTKVEQHSSSLGETQSVATATVTAGVPCVSCIMPTADRPKFVSQAIKYFQRQDYPNRELIILDDGSDAVADLVPPDTRIRYLRMAERRSMGAKHNLACEMAQGDIILHWDDDDWMADWRLSYQVQELLQQPPMTLCGLAQLLFYEPRTDRAWEYVYPTPERPWVSGGTFCYRKHFWEQRRFRDMNEGADTAYVWSLRDARVSALHNRNFYVATVHAQNTSRKRTDSSGWAALPSPEVRRLFNDEDRSFYESLSDRNLRTAG
jgi:hypothetical protein